MTIASASTQEGPKFTAKDFASAYVCTKGAASDAAIAMLKEFAQEMGFAGERSAAVKLNNSREAASMFASASMNFADVGKTGFIVPSAAPNITTPENGNGIA